MARLASVFVVAVAAAALADPSTASAQASAARAPATPASGLTYKSAREGTDYDRAELTCRRGRS